MTDAPPGAAPSPAGLNQHQGRRVSSTFAYVDDLLRDVERLARLRPSPFNRERQDLSEVEADLVLAFVQTARERMLNTLDRLHLARPKATLSARWGIMTALRFVDTALSELDYSTLRGYGEIDADLANEVAAVAGALRALAARGLDLLQPRQGEQLRERLESVAGPLGEVLRRAETISREHGLVEVRALIAAAAERAEASTIDVGVFGRVSSGKSSLVNALVGVPLLPVGATPVTAVPLRVAHGPEEIRVHFRDRHTEVIGPERLAEFATEGGNPDNARGVQSILIHTPQLPEGLALLDTPGVGSLSQSGPAQAFAWLPRCDLGLVLIAAGTPVGRDELALVAGLSRAGIPVEVLLSKSDLVPEPERDAAVAYARREIEQATGATVIVHPVSVTPSDRVLLDGWRDAELIPLVAARQRTATTALARRVQALLESLNVALQGRRSLESSTIDLERARVEAKKGIEALVDDLQGSSDAVLARTADQVALAWKASTDARAAARRSLLETPGRALSRARELADSVLVPGDAADDGELGSRIPPLFDPPLLDALPVQPNVGAIGRLFAASAARQQLSSIATPLAEAYSTYANRLRAWALERLDENAERNAATGHGERAPLAGELRALVELVDQRFPTDAPRPVEASA